MDTNGVQMIAVSLGVNFALAAAIAPYVILIVDGLKKYMGKIGPRAVVPLAWLVSLGIAVVITLGRVGVGAITGAVILQGILLGVVTGLLVVGGGKLRAAVPDNRPYDNTIALGAPGTGDSK